MLVLSRRIGERIIINGNITANIIVKVLEVRGDTVRLGIKAPKEIRVNREEVHGMEREPLFKDRPTGSD